MSKGIVWKCKSNDNLSTSLIFQRTPIFERFPKACIFLIAPLTVLVAVQADLISATAWLQTELIFTLIFCDSARQSEKKVYFQTQLIEKFYTEKPGHSSGSSWPTAGFFSQGGWWHR